MQHQKSWRTILRLVGALAGGFLFFRFFGPVLLPFALGLLPAKAASNAADRLQTQFRVPRRVTACVCVGILYILFFLLVFLLGRLLFLELEGFFRSLPALAGSLTEPVARLKQTLLRLASRFPDGVGAALEQWTLEFFRSGAGIGEKLYEMVFSFASNVIGMAPDIAMFTLTALLSGFMLAVELPELQALWQRKAPRQWQSTWHNVIQKLKGTLFCWFKAQGKLIGITFLVLTVSFLILRVEYAFLFAVVIALLDALPVLGSGVFLIPWSLVRFLAGDTFRGVGLLCIYAAAALLRTALEPKLLGKQMGLNPLLTLLALYAGYHFFGIWGMILFPMGVMFAKQILN